MAAEILTRRRALEAPPVGGRPHEGEAPRDYNARMRQAAKARRDAAAQAEGHDYARDCACAGCLVWGAVQAHDAAVRIAPRGPTRGDFALYDPSTWGASTPRGG